MNRVAALSLSFATLSIAVLAPALVQAQSGSSEAMQMVSARVALKQNIDADKVKPGDRIRAALSAKVSLKDGTELPAGTTILGVVTTDDMQLKGTSKLALNFTQAVLKDGKVIAIKATILGIYPPESQDMNGNPVTPGDQEHGNWAGHPDDVDEVGALPGVDLHSKIASSNSGVLVSTSKHDMKLRWGSEFALAVAPMETAKGE